MSGRTPGVLVEDLRAALAALDEEQVTRLAARLHEWRQLIRDPPSEVGFDRFEHVVAVLGRLPSTDPVRRADLWVWLGELEAALADLLVYDTEGLAETIARRLVKDETSPLRSVTDVLSRIVAYAHREQRLSARQLQAAVRDEEDGWAPSSPPADDTDRDVIPADDPDFVMEALRQQIDALAPEEDDES